MNYLYQLQKTELLELESQSQQLLKELQWKKLKLEHSLQKKQEARQDCIQRLERESQRLLENQQVLLIFSELNPLRKKVQEDIFKGAIRVEKLKRRLANYSRVVELQQVAKLEALNGKIAYYEQLLWEIGKILNPPLEENPLFANLSEIDSNLPIKFAELEETPKEEYWPLAG